MSNPSPKRLCEHVRALDVFATAYRAFVEGDESPARRQAVHSAIPAAQRAIEASNHHMAIQEPAATGGRAVYSGLPTLAFLHERPEFQLGIPVQVPLLDNVAGARAKLLDMAAQEQRRRRSPAFWVDRVVRGLLAVPAYLVSRVVGVPVARIERSSWGFPLRVLAIAADSLGVYIALVQFGVL